MCAVWCSSKGKESAVYVYIGNLINACRKLLSFFLSLFNVYFGRRLRPSECKAAKASEWIKIQTSTSNGTPRRTGHAADDEHDMRNLYKWYMKNWMKNVHKSLRAKSN